MEGESVFRLGVRSSGGRRPAGPAAFWEFFFFLGFGGFRGVLVFAKGSRMDLGQSS